MLDSSLAVCAEEIKAETVLRLIHFLSSRARSFTQSAGMTSHSKTENCTRCP